MGTIELTQEQLENFVTPTSPRQTAVMLEAEDAGAIIARRFGTQFKCLVDKGPGSRTTHIVRARAAFCLYLKRECKWSFPAIGRILNRDHTTIITIVQRYANLIPSYLYTIQTESLES